MTTNARSAHYFRKMGATTWRTEHWNSFSRRREDLFGIFDLIVLRPGINGVLGVQSTSRNCMSARRNKMRASEHLKTWMECGNQAWILGWDKRKNRYRVKEERL